MAGKRKTCKKINSTQKSKSPPKSPISVNSETPIKTTCCACRSQEPPDQIKRYPEKPWIQCDVCNSWWHLECSFLRVEDLKKIDKHKILFPCALCIIKHSPWIQFENSKDKISNKISFKSAETQTDTVPSPNFIPIDSSIIKQNISKTESVIEKLHIPKLCQVNKPTILDTERHTDNFVIIDGITAPLDFQDSREIKKEIIKHKKVKAKYAYPLSRGGIGVHTENQADKEKLLQRWPEGSFKTNTDTLNVHENTLKPLCVFKNVPTNIQVDSVGEEVKTQTGVAANLRRLRYRDTHKPLPVVIVECESFQDQQKLFQSNFTVGKKTILVQAYRSKTNIPTRCFQCQEFRHIAAICKKVNFCENCAESHVGKCKNKQKCKNCSGVTNLAIVSAQHF
ncbi:uncharacterized protein LOC128208115 [Mya arenaria]|uniref:uncharacterized protein LOC128208115 n=1 Tax=Mya arenaria TaxID=6604 RepID=UPI0022DF1638|nr:uncharacterized protein LOC128208115 [Mya arenaria]XP_052767419.1 uncharacterized protein LOC128208115 [Mya arenaria]XP_052767421.1 uncharacterized protein LOC128208115 [Mya arenaria]XP_052767422.1 uncharacterized protein LOC128208115 [Mya arenaria]